MCLFWVVGSLLVRRLSLVVVSRGYSVIVVHGFLIAVAFLFAEHMLWGARASGVAASRI